MLGSFGGKRAGMPLDAERGRCSSLKRARFGSWPYFGAIGRLIWVRVFSAGRAAKSRQRVPCLLVLLASSRLAPSANQLARIGSFLGTSHEW